MANRTQIQMLKRGVRVWNQWRVKNSKVSVNLQNANLKGLIYLMEFSDTKINFILVAPLALRDGLRRKERIVESAFRHDYAALASFRRVGQNAKVVP